MFPTNLLLIKNKLQTIYIMMKWFAFVGAAFVASSHAISIGSTDAESMSEAYPEFHFA